MRSLAQRRSFLGEPLDWILEVMERYAQNTRKSQSCFNLTYTDMHCN